MKKIRSGKSKFTDARFAANSFRKQREKRDRAKKYLRSCTIKLNPDLPQDLHSFLQFYRKHRDPKNPGYVSFARHCLTNYDRICKTLFWRFGISMDDELKEIIHDRVHEFVLPYLGRIGFLGWYNSRISSKRSTIVVVRDRVVECRDR